jgi:DNA-binding transcriptional ArsR family regulator
MAIYRNELVDRAVEIASALSDATRVRILMALCGGELCACQIVMLIGLAQSTVSKHLSVLKQAGLVTSRKCGRWIYFKLADDCRKRGKADDCSETDEANVCFKGNREGGGFDDKTGGGARDDDRDRGARIIAGAIRWLKENLTDDVQIEADRAKLARILAMSVEEVCRVNLKN